MDKDNLVRALEKQIHEAVTEKSILEVIAAEDELQYRGDTDTLWNDKRNHFAKDSEQEREPPGVKLTRVRCNTISSRLINMLLPSNERAFESDPSPEQDELYDQIKANVSDQVIQMAQMEGQEVPREEIDKAIREALKETEDQEYRKAKRMQRVIDDQLHECRFTKSGRKVIRDAVRLGTGILKGPYNKQVERRKAQFANGATAIVIESKQIPAVRWVDWWNFYPHITEDIEKSEYAWESHFMTRTELRVLARQPGFDLDAVREVLEKDPGFGTLTNSITNRTRFTGLDSYKGRYVVWEGATILDRKTLEDCGVEIAEGMDELDSYLVEVWICDGKLLKLEAAPLEHDLRLPFYCFNLVKDETILFGPSVPFMCRGSARSVDATWNMALYNGSVSAGFQIVRKEGVIRATTGSTRVRGPTEWISQDDEGSVQNAIHFAALPVTIQHVLELHDRARANLDEEIALPLISQGDPTEAVPTFAGLSMKMNAANVHLRDTAVNWDDDLLGPVIQRMNEWNLLYNQREDIKGDFIIKTHGATKLVVRDMQIQHLLYALQLAANDPEFAAKVDRGAMIEKLVKMMDIDPDEILLDADELAQQKEAMANQPPPPEVMKVQLQQAELEFEKQKWEAEFAFRREDAEIRHAEMTRNDVVRLRQTDARILEKRMEMEMLMLELAHKGELKEMDLDQKERIAEMVQMHEDYRKSGDWQMWANEMEFKVARSPDGRGI